MDANRKTGPQFGTITPTNVRTSLGRAAALVAIMAAGTIAFVATPSRVLSQVTQIVTVDVSLVAQGYRASRLIGTGVINEKKEKIGSIDDIIIDTHRDLFAVLQVGGFLGLGAHLVAVPYQSLKVEDGGRTIELPGATKDALKGFAEFKYRS